MISQKPNDWIFREKNKDDDMLNIKFNFSIHGFERKRIQKRMKKVIIACHLLSSNANQVKAQEKNVH